MELCIRRLTPTALAAFEEMVFALYAEDTPGRPMTTTKIHKTVEELNRHPQRGAIMLMEIDSHIVGYAILIYFWSNEYGGELITIDELYVRPEWRHQGIGSRFLEYVADTYKAIGAGIQLEVTPDNMKILEYYRKRGFRPSPNHHLLATPWARR